MSSGGQRGQRDQGIEGKNKSETHEMRTLIQMQQNKKTRQQAQRSKERFKEGGRGK